MFNSAHLLYQKHTPARLALQQPSHSQQVKTLAHTSYVFRHTPEILNMKKIICTTAMALAVFMSATAQLKSGFSVSQNSNGRETKTVIESNNNGQYFKLESTGNITLNDSETAIESISDGGSLKYRKNDSRFIAESKNGVITYQLNEDGQELDPTSEKGIKFIATVVKELISLGFDAQRHVARLYKRGGSGAVLAEVGDLKNDYVKRVYLEELLKIGNLNTAEMNTVAKSIAAIGGNYEKSQLLQKFAGAYLNNPLSVQPYFDAVGTIGGDYEKSQVLQADLKQQLTPAILSQLLTLAGTIGGDYEKSQVLQAALKEQLTTTALGQMLAAAATIGGDYEKANVLKKAIKIHSQDEENCNKVLNAADGIHGDYEKASVLNAVIASGNMANSSFDLLLKVAGRMGSAYEKSNVFKALVAKITLTPDQWVSFINTVAGIDAAYEKSNVLIAVAGKMPADAKVRDAYMTTAKTIGSNYEYEQVVKAVK